MRFFPWQIFWMCLLGWSALAAEPEPLSTAAARLAVSLPKGAIVTGELVGETPAYGAAGHLEVDAVPERAIFEIGSLTKAFTGLLLAQAVTEGRVTLDTTLHETLGKAVSFSDPAVGQITLRQLATHTSGLPRLPEDLESGAVPGDPYAHYDRARLFSYLATAKPQGKPPYTKSYSNLGVGLLGDVLSFLYGRPWEALIVEKITGPLGMKDTVVQLNEEQQKRFTPAYDGEKAVKRWNMAALSGAGGLRSTAADLLLFGRALLHPEQTSLREALAVFLQPQTRDGDIGLGIGLGKIYGQRVYEHNGGTGGYCSGFRVGPDSNWVQVVLINNAALEAESVLAAAHHEKPRATATEKVMQAKELAEYEGVYSLAGARLTVLRRENQLWAQLTGQGFLQLHAQEKTDRFACRGVAAEIQFLREADRIVSLTLFQNGREVQAPKSDVPLPKLLFRTAEELADFAGTYELLPGVTFTIKVAAATVFVKLTGQNFAPVFEKQKDWFEYDIVSAALEFERDEAGKVIALKLHQNGLIQRAVKAL